MSVHVTTAALSQAALVATLAAAVWCDVRTGRIPNRLVVSGVVAAMLLHGIGLTTDQAPLAGPGPWAWLSGCLVGGLVILPLYMLRACGAGDVKLLGMVGAFVGANVAISAALFTFAAGGVLSLVVIALRGVGAQTLSNLRFMLTDWGLRATTGQGLRLAPLSTTAARLPYAVAIAAGTFIALWRPLPLLE